MFYLGIKLEQLTGSSSEPYPHKKENRYLGTPGPALDIFPLYLYFGQSITSERSLRTECLNLVKYLISHLENPELTDPTVFLKSKS